MYHLQSEVVAKTLWHDRGHLHISKGEEDVTDVCGTPSLDFLFLSQNH